MVCGGNGGSWQAAVWDLRKSCGLLLSLGHDTQEEVGHTSTSRRSPTTRLDLTRSVRFHYDSLIRSMLIHTGLGGLCRCGASRYRATGC